jgi:hypothetical protein
VICFDIVAKANEIPSHGGKHVDWPTLTTRTSEWSSLLGERTATPEQHAVLADIQLTNQIERHGHLIACGTTHSNSTIDPTLG